MSKNKKNKEKDFDKSVVKLIKGLSRFYYELFLAQPVSIEAVQVTASSRSLPSTLLKGDRTYKDFASHCAKHHEQILALFSKKPKVLLISKAMLKRFEKQNKL